MDNLLERAFAVGTVEGSYAGGLAGRTASNGTQEKIINSFANVDVNGSAAAGGLVGKMEMSRILRSQSFGDVTSRTRAGGLVGGFWHDGKIYDSIASGNVKVESSTGCYAGGIAGWNNNKTPTISRTIATGTVSHASGGNCQDANHLGPIVSDEFSASHIPQAAFYVNAVAGGNTLGAQATPIELQALETYEQASPAWTIDGKIEEVADCANPSSTANLTLCPNRVPFPSTIGLLSTTNTPANLQATPTFEGIDLSWTAPTELGNSPIVGYRIESSVDGASWSTEVNDTRRSLTQYSLVALNPGTAYHLRVSALNAMGASTPVATASPVTAGTVPGAPTNLSVDAVQTTAVDLSWSAPSVSGATAISDYTVEYSSDAGASWSTFADGVSTATSASVTNLSEGTTYRFRVSAKNTQGESTPSTATADTPVGDLPEAPTDLERVVWAADTVGVAWTPGDSGTGSITQFTVEYSDDDGGSWTAYPTTATGSASRLSVDGLTEGQEYQFRVIASNAIGDGPASETLTEVAGLLPGRPN
ncbi:MAG: fibronectin type III domain-containing protein, partial [Wenzhouxiangella sp.]|nr:fibronectin type III domain-containing protein [Wenzhouxiangella sp.]